MRRPGIPTSRPPEDLGGSPTGRARWLPILLLGAVLSLDTADRSTLSASEAQLEHGLGVGAAQFGLLAAVTPLAGLVLTVPLGALADRVPRTRALAVVALVWAAAEVVVAVAPSVAVLTVGRAALGVVLAALPAVASLAGDWFPTARRARDYGYVLSGELVGTGIGFVGTGSLAQALSWRWGFAALAVAGVAVAALAWLLPEPERGAQRVDDVAGRRSGSLQDQVADRGVPPSPTALLRRDPAESSLRTVLGYVLRVRSNVALVVASALAYLFLSGVQTFALRFGADELGLTGSGATAMLVGLGAAAIVGVVVSGRLADRLVAGGRLDARTLVASGALAVALLCFLPGTLVGDVAVAVPLLLVGGAALGSANPPLDSARLDVLHHHAWGRAESMRSVVRLVAYAAAPALVGALITVVGTGPAFAVLTGALALGAVAALVARRSYLHDVAAAGRSPVDAPATR